MPGAHLDLMLMQCWPDVGGCDAWLGGFWTEEDGRHQQWWTGWHLPGPSGPEGLTSWQWPSPHWRLIGYELWGSFRRGPKLLEACYAYPNPSTTEDPESQVPEGHWHLKWHPNGREISRDWSPEALIDDHPYIKGGVFTPKGGHQEAKGKGKGKPKGSKGQATNFKGKGTPKGRNGKGKNKGGKGKGN